MKAYKVEILIVDHDRLGSDQILAELENARFANDCINLQVKSIQGKDIGKWHDDHPLNKLSTCETEYQRLFKSDVV